MEEQIYLEPIDFSLSTLYSEQRIFIKMAEVLMREYLKLYLPLVIGLIFIILLGLFWIKYRVKQEDFKLGHLILPIIITTIFSMIMYGGISAIVEKDKETYAGIEEVEDVFINITFRGIVNKVLDEGYSEEEIKNSIEVELSEVYTEERIEEFIKPGFLPTDYVTELQEKLFKEIEDLVDLKNNSTDGEESREEKGE